MANVLNKTTLEYKESVNTPDFPKEDYLHDPDPNVIKNVPERYWKVSGESLKEMSPDEKAAKDAQTLSEDISSFAQALKDKLESYLFSKYSTADLVAISIIHQAAIIQGLQTRAAMCEKLSVFITQIYLYQSQKEDEIDAAPDFKALQLIAFDFNQFDPIDPALSLKGILAVDS